MMAHPVFASIAADALQESVEACLSAGLLWAQEFASGAELIHQGDRGSVMFLLLTGSVAVFEDAPLRQGKLIAELDAGEIVGEMAIFAGGYRTASVRARSAGSLLAFHEDAVRTLLARFPSISQGMLALIAKRRGEPVRGALPPAVF